VVVHNTQFSPQEAAVIAQALGWDSGKGGTGKTSGVASFATLAGRCVLVDCDVDAADLHLIFEPKVIRRKDFTGGNKARIKPGHCTACGKCEELCRFNAVYFDGPRNGRVAKTFRIETTACEGCGVCVDYCADNAIEFAPAVCGQWFASETRCGPMVHAKLGVGADNSGKLVIQIRRAAAEVAAQRKTVLEWLDQIARTSSGRAYNGPHLGAHPMESRGFPPNRKHYKLSRERGNE
jgi:MinD superfamily P-loop ATPase